MFFIMQDNLGFQLPIPFSLIFSVLIGPGSFPDLHNTTLGQRNYPSCEELFLWPVPRNILEEKMLFVPCEIKYKMLSRISELPCLSSIISLLSFSLSPFFLLAKVILLGEGSLGTFGWATWVGLLGSIAQSKQIFQNQTFWQGAFKTCGWAFRLRNTGSNQTLKKSRCSKKEVRS